MITDKIVIVRGGGDVATGCIQKLHRSGFGVLVLESDNPLCIRRTVSVAEAMVSGSTKVEDLTVKRVGDISEALATINKGIIPVIEDVEGNSIELIKPIAVIDATIAKKNIGTNRNMAPITIALGPGYYANRDVDYVIETNRGHNLGRIIFEGFAAENTHKPGLIGGYDNERVYYSPMKSTIKVVKDITESVKKGDVIAYANDVEIKADINGVVRGMIRNGAVVGKHTKIADIDPRDDAEKYCFTISDKARNIGGAVLEALMIGLNRMNSSDYQIDNKQFSKNVGK